MEESDMYEKICKPHFEKMESELSKLNNLIRGENGTPGLLETVRNLKRVNMWVFGIVSAIGIAAIGQFIHFLFEKF